MGEIIFYILQRSFWDAQFCSISRSDLRLYFFLNYYDDQCSKNWMLYDSASFYYSTFRNLVIKTESLNLQTTTINKRENVRFIQRFVISGILSWKLMSKRTNAESIVRNIIDAYFVSRVVEHLTKCIWSVNQHDSMSIKSSVFYLKQPYKSIRMFQTHFSTGAPVVTTKKLATLRVHFFLKTKYILVAQ